MKPSLLSAKAVTELAHELRSPLGGLEAMADMLSATRLSEEQNRMVAALQASAAHLRQIADRVLGGGRSESEDAASLFDVVLEPMINSFHARAAVKGVRFDVDIADGVRGERIAWPCAFRQIIENLVDNALRFSSGGCVRLEIGGVGDRLSVAVLDEGPGLARADAERLIAEGGSIPGRAGGAGIGLSISGRLVARHGGTLTGGPRAEGAGACFAFDWPIEKRQSGQGQRCLVVDDHPASRLVLRTILGAFGCICEEAETISDARALLAEKSFDVVFTDLRLGEEDGRDLVIGLTRDAEMLPRVIVVSADPLPADDPVAALVDAQVLKPLTVQAIADSLNRLPARRRPESASQAA